MCLFAHVAHMLTHITLGGATADGRTPAGCWDVEGCVYTQGLPCSCLESLWLQQIRGYPSVLVCTAPGWCQYVLVALYRLSRTLWLKFVSPCRFNRTISLWSLAVLGRLTYIAFLQKQGKEACVICFPHPSAALCVLSALKIQHCLTKQLLLCLERLEN